ncbi:MAG: ribonuclease Z [Solirubrobacteraceae bacterium]|nr:ribonuclease Z [Solirubrobacteraceae bacterium]
MDLSVFFAGTGASSPSARRGLSATLLRAGGDRLLIDCGEGTQRQLVKSVGLPDLDAVFLTHLHADHWFGLPGMLKSFDLRDRSKPLEVYGPVGTKALLERVQPVFGRLGYPLDIEELDTDESLRFDEYRIKTFPTRHRGPSIGFQFVEDDRPGRFDAGEATRLGITPGPEFGQLQRGETVRGVEPSQVMGETRRGRRIVFTGDTRPSDATVVAAAGADLLVHEGTFASSEKDRAAETAHSTGAQAAQVAFDADVRLLAVTPIAARVHAGELEREVRGVFERAVVVRDFDEIELPLPDRGDPIHHRWSDRRRELAEAAGAGPAAERGAEPPGPSVETGAEQAEPAVPPEPVRSGI